MAGKTKTKASPAPSEHITLSLTDRESDCLKTAARALRSSIALMLTAAALEAAHKLGYYEGHSPGFPPRPRAWSDAPRRREGEAARVRLTITMAPLFLSTLRRAASEQLGTDYRLSTHGGPAPLHAFLLGAGLRFVATHVQRASLQAANSRSSQEERDEAAVFLETLTAHADLSVLEPYLGRQGH